MLFFTTRSKKVRSSMANINTVRREPWEKVVQDFCTALRSSLYMHEDEVKQQLFSLVQMEMMFRTNLWVELAKLGEIETKTNSLVEFGKELSALEHKLITGKSPFACSFHAMV